MPNPLFEEAYSFDDLLLVPSYSDVLPKDVTVNTRLTRHISLSVPIVSAAMDTVTEADAAISMAREGGLGFIHRNLEIKTQALEVDKVKKSESGMIVDPVTIRPDQKVAEVLKLMEQYRISGVPVTQGDKLGRHRHQPGSALRNRHGQEGVGRDDQGPAGHGHRGHRSGRVEKTAP